MLYKNKGLRFASMVAGVVLTAVVFPLFFIPNDIAPGGITGIATLIRALLGFPVGMTAIVLNIPLFIIGYRQMGHSFVLKSIAATVGISLLIDLLPTDAVTNDPMLAAIFGGILMGFGIGLVIRSGATTGGTDMAATLLHAHIPIISVGSVLLFIDFLVIIASGIIFDLQSAMYALISVFLATQVMDRTVEGLGSAKAFFVFSKKTQEIASEVLINMGRGATLLHAKGAYSQRESEVLLCVIIRTQIPQFKAIVNALDPSAFLIVTDVREAMGEGFTRATEITDKNVNK